MAEHEAVNTEQEIVQDRQEKLGEAKQNLADAREAFSKAEKEYQDAFVDSKPEYTSMNSQPIGYVPPVEDFVMVEHTEDSVSSFLGNSSADADEQKALENGDKPESRDANEVADEKQNDDSVNVQEPFGAKSETSPNESTDSPVRF